jgi:hypothetical protein
MMSFVSWESTSCKRESESATTLAGLGNAVGVGIRRCHCSFSPVFLRWRINLVMSRDLG